ncbi:MAG: hypothetical protein KatS3mg118_2347 [Paracoccaceae bacterium]|nr:MAG: hypothetical protein KatS3mg118_2347 [Paracoccaceae bacterium]
MDRIGEFYREEGEFVLSFAPLGLVVRGSHPEWVLSAAADIIRASGEIGAESRVLAAESRAAEDRAAIARFDARERFARTPICTINLGESEFRWVPPARPPG